MGKLFDLFRKSDVYSLAIRKRPEEGLLFENNFATFSVLPISKKYWYADPIIFNYEGVDYLFCEVYDRSKDIGYIGVSVIREGVLKKPEIIMDIGSHLSYPCVFEQNGTIYMIPETTTQKNVQLYKANNFPYEWEFVRELLNDEEFADSTFFQKEDKQILLTFQHYKGNGSITKTHVFSAMDIEAQGLKAYSSNDFDFNDYSRGAGKLFEYKQKVYRPAQICTKEYGYALNFMQVSFDDNNYNEKIVASVYPESLMFAFKKKIKGIHTYALTDDYEIIDVKFDDPRLRYQIRRIWRYIKRKLFERGK